VAFISEFNYTGTALVYSTYLGGSGGGAAFAPALDSGNNAYVTGSTCSTNFPKTSGAFQTVNKSAVGGNPTILVTKINAAGDILTYSTYRGARAPRSALHSIS
jgi:hypothetical protein